MNALVLDVDGTLADARGCVDESIVDALRTASDHFLLVLATARPLFGLTRILDTLSMRCACITANGALVGWSDEPEPMERHAFTGASQEKAISVLQSVSGVAAIFGYAEREWHAVGDPSAIRFEAHILGVSPQTVSYSLAEALAWRRATLLKITAVSDSESNWHAIAGHIGREAGSLFTSSPSSQSYVEVGASGVSKGTALRTLRRACDIDQVFAIGDGANDICMFEEADVSFAMPASPDVVKLHATHSLRERREIVDVVRSLC